MLLATKYRTQLFATVVGNLLSLAFGIAQGWPSPILPLLQSDETPLERPLTLEESSWVASLYLIGGLVSPPIFGWMVNRVGRKTSLLVSVIPQLISWIMIEFSRTATHLYIARFMVGLGGSGFFLALPMYVAEISLDEVRGALGSIMMVSTNLGIVIGYTVNSFLDYRTVPLLVIGILLAFILGFPFAADSPKHLMVQNKAEQAIAALKFFRGHTMTDEQFSKEHRLEIEALRAYGSSSQTADGQNVTLQDFTSRSTLMAITIGAVVMYLEVLNGFTAISNYSETIFRDAGSTLSPAVSTIILGFIILIGAYCSTFLVERAGRRILMVTSTTGCGISLTVVAAYAYVKDNGYDVTPYSWAPLIFLSTFMLFASIGVITIHMVIVSEILAQKTRSVVTTCLILENNVLSFLTVKYFPILMTIIGMHGCMLIFAASCFGGGLFILFVMPETKGRSIEDIVAELGGARQH